jgi:hypothetical protein
MLRQKARIDQLAAADGPEIKVFGLRLKSQKRRWKLPAIIAKLGAAGPERRADRREEIFGPTSIARVEQANDLQEKAVHTPSPSAMDICNDFSNRIDQEHGLAIGYLDEKPCALEVRHQSISGWSEHNRVTILRRAQRLVIDQVNGVAVHLNTGYQLRDSQGILHAAQILADRLEGITIVEGNV